ncbi:hypothetical protein FE257_006733 [Aspergillus nanangensis]|uniref:Beta-lactamase-related domain-containing protein n=1 Tax=Aspergillus nanangensis TaxID=2582783 RepID=A0AAD4GW14_ASPNN|nr:hypothetical protein FE257_006733 [Aspergillus nanangensis]
MTSFDEILAASTARGTNIVPGCVLAAVDKTGNKFYSKAAGYDSVLPNSPRINPHGTFWLASCSKLIGTIAALQCVDRGQIKLDEPVERVIPELASLQIIEPVRPGNMTTGDVFTLRPATKKITLRHLLCHTSGISYDMFHPLLMAWRTSRQEEPLMLSGKLVEAYATPLLFEPGDGWTYGGGIDWAGELAARLNELPLEHYCQKYIFGPLNLNSTTFRLGDHPYIKEQLVSTSERAKDGTLKPAARLWPDESQEDCAGGGLYSSSNDYMKILGDLLSDEPTLLTRWTVEGMFQPQLENGSRAVKDLEAATIFGAMTSIRASDGGINWGLGGLYTEKDAGSIRKGSLVWGGLPNLVWFVNREHGLAGLYASQMLPPGDPQSGKLANEFMNHIWRVAGKA